MEFLIETIVGWFLETLFGRLLIMLPGGTIRWLFSGRKRRWREFQVADESFNNFRAICLFVLIAGGTAGITYCFI